MRISDWSSDVCSSDPRLTPRRLLRMRWIFHSRKRSPHAEEPAKRASRSTHDSITGIGDYTPSESYQVLRSKLWTASMYRPVPDFERITTEWVVAPPDRTSEGEGKRVSDRVDRG